ncbi:transmembrane emp24 domain-containing p24delta3-like [Olea europaea subsp. europaea]|uniref:Transmembrane emp24 domain-containing p24delta3-like n=1 Tax=Olea europaea subsp. europaea TaxID=158383 RepID=A0A8S0TVH7_OLEEU|nr:transmembrane emp24 domain-containing p24delta3-like [Olea europaea subsp. europaea]
MPASGTKSVCEEIQNKVVILADYIFISDDRVRPNLSISIKAGNYVACFWVDSHNPGGGEISVNIDWKTGIAAKDWESVPREEKIEGVELE